MPADGQEGEMQRSRRIPPARTTKRDVYDDVAEEALRSPEYSFGMSEDKVGKVSDIHVPLSLRTGAGRQYRDEVFRLLVKIRVECDAAAERLGYASAQDDGLAAVEYIASKILDAVRGERQQQKVSIKREPQAKSRRSRGEETPTEVTYKSEKGAQRASHSERSKLIDELKQMLRDKKTKSGAFIDPQLAHEIAKHITILNEAAAQPETKKSIKQFRQSIAPVFAKLYGARKKLTKQNVTSEGAKVKTSRRTLPRAKKNVRKISKGRTS
jgi:hypothetical protein